MRTAIWKDSVAGPRMVRRINIDGDDQGDRLAHGGEQRAVLVYQLESYWHGRAELHRDDLSPGEETADVAACALSAAVEEVGGGGWEPGRRW